MKLCEDCERISADGSTFCLHCGSANVEDVSDLLPFEGEELDIIVDGQRIASGRAIYFVEKPDNPKDN